MELRGAVARIIAAVGALILIPALVSPAMAYTLSRNNFPGSPVGCTNVDPYWCIEWPLASNGYSSTTYVYLDPSLGLLLSGETLDLRQEARNAFARWNPVPARSPFLVEVASVSQSSGYGSPNNCSTRIRRGPAGLTYGFARPFTQYERTGSGSRQRIVCLDIAISDSRKFDTDADPNDGFADARFVLGHELGHGLGLGHTNYVALMYHTWPNSVYMGITPTSDDTLGLQVAYGAP